MRTYLIIVVAIGIMSSVLSHRPSHRPSAESAAAAYATEDREQDSSESSDSQSSASTVSSEGGALDIPRSSDGHFYADVDVNGAKLHMLIDTGATGIALSRDDARAAGIATSIGMNDVVGEGADGSVRGEWVQIDRMSLGNANAQAMPAIVLNNGSQSLLGQSFLARFASVEIRGDTMTLR